MNKYAISPVPPSNVKGSDFAGVPFSFEWDVNIPWDGEYIFRGAKDNRAEFYLDNNFISKLNNYTGALTPIKKTLKKGTHKIRLDVLNLPVREKYESSLTTRTAGAILEAEDHVDGDWQDIVCYAKEGRFFGISGNEGKYIIDGNPGEKKEVEFRVTTSAMFVNKLEIEGLFAEIGPLYKEGIEQPFQLNKTFKKTVEVGKVYPVSVVNVSGASNRGRIKIRSKVVPGEVKKVKVPSSTETAVEVRNVFNTVDYIDKANRQLWRSNVYARGGFINEYGVCPFDTVTVLEDNPYAGTHRIRWAAVNFPVSGNYTIQVAVDDNVRLKIGDKVEIFKQGFSTPGDGGTSTGDSKYIKFIEKGMHEIVADLDQIGGGRFGFDQSVVDTSVKGINPMSLAINITADVVELERDVVKSWNQNPMGVALAIQAPLPPIPQQPIPQAEGRCPNNPIWSTRFPNSEKKWHPVKFPVWSKFTNKYAMSPIPPFSTASSDKGGIKFTNTWNLDIPYDGWYGVRGTKDNFGKLMIDGKEVSSLNHFKTPKPTLTKVFLGRGAHTITVEVEN